MHLLLDSGPWVALLCRDERHHEWARAQFEKITLPLLTCEAVVAETCFLLASAGFDPARALQFIERGVVQVSLCLSEEVGPVKNLFQRYENAPASLADACLIRLSELYDPCRVLTLDSDFQVYRRLGRKTIPVICP